MAQTARISGHTVTFDIATVERGLWCSQCLLPSVQLLEVRTLCEHGVRTIGSVHGCTEHANDVRLTPPCTGDDDKR